LKAKSCRVQDRRHRGAKSRPERERDAYARANEAQIFRAIFNRRNVRNVALGHSNAAPSEARQRSAPSAKREVPQLNNASEASEIKRFR